MKKGKFKRFAAMFLAALTLTVSMTSCGKTDSGSDSNGGDTPGGGTVIDYERAEAMLPEKINETGVNIVENGRSDYKIVVPDDADALISFAAKEMQTFIKDSTGAELPIIGDSGADFDETAKYISIGQTLVFKGSGLDITDDMKDTGYFMKRFGNTVVIVAKNSNGSLSAVYDFLNYEIGLEVYATDELTYEKKSVMPLFDYDIKFIPVLDRRKILAEAFDASDVYTKRMRLWSWFGLGEWITFAHTTVEKFLPKDRYYEAHPDWYSESGTQVCYSNAEMRAAMEEAIKSYISSSPDGFYVMIGHEDDKFMCGCDNCVAERELMGGYGGQELNFTNTVAEELEPWLLENYPDREIYFVFFAYQTSEEPPAKYDETTGKWTPVWKDFKVNRNVKVMCAPVYTDFSQNLTGETNASYYKNMKGWSEIFKQAGVDDGLVIWTYSTAAVSYFATINNFAISGEHYRTLSDLGAVYVMDQNTADSNLPMLEQLKLYTMSKMMYRRDYDYNELVDDFIDHYYGAAAEEMTEYYEFIRARYKWLNENMSFTGRIFSDTTLPAYWPRPVVQEMLDIIDRGLDKLETIKTSDPERYEILYARLKREKLSPIYFMFEYYMDYLTQDKKEEYYNDMEVYTAKFNILGTREGANNMLSKLEGWKSQIYG